MMSQLTNSKNFKLNSKQELTQFMKGMNEVMKGMKFGWIQLVSLILGDDVQW